MKTDHQTILINLNNDLELIKTIQDFQNIKSKYLGKKGEIKSLMSNLSNIDPDKRKDYGKEINIIKEKAESMLNQKLNELKDKENKLKALKNWVDITIPGAKKTLGKEHLISSTIKDVCVLFANLGFEVVEGYEVEKPWFNFDALNTPKWHPARDMQDTFYLDSDDELLLRTHTSPVQVRTMLKKEPPLAIVSPGRVFRKDEIDATHSPVFHQLEGLYIDKNVSVSHLKYFLELFAKRFFGKNVEILLRPSFFPFVEPGFEVDFSCIFCKGKGCNVCGNTGWIEILGAGLVHPNVLENVNYDSKKWQGLAFGIGIERIAMLKNNILDMRELFKNDINFIES